MLEARISLLFFLYFSFFFISRSPSRSSTYRRYNISTTQRLTPENKSNITRFIGLPTAPRPLPYSLVSAKRRPACRLNRHHHRHYYRRLCHHPHTSPSRDQVKRYNKLPPASPSHPPAVHKGDSTTLNRRNNNFK